MAAVPAIGLGTSLLGTVLGYSQASKAQKAAQQNADLQAQQMANANAQSAAQYAELKPALDATLNYGLSSTPPDYAKYADLVRQNYAPVMRQQANGPIANSGLASASLQGAQLGQAGNLAQAYTAAKDKQRSVLQSLIAPERQAGQSYINNLNGMGNFYGQRASMLGQTAANQYAGVGQGIAGIANQLGKLNFSGEWPNNIPETPGSDWGENKQSPLSIAPQSENSNNGYNNFNPNIPGFGQNASSQAFGGGQQTMNPYAWSGNPLKGENNG